MKTANDILHPYVETPFRHTSVISKENAFKAMNEFAKEESISFLDWLMTNCDLSEDQTIWSYMGEDYSLEGIHELFIINTAVQKHFEHK